MDYLLLMKYQVNKMEDYSFAGSRSYPLEFSLYRLFTQEFGDKLTISRLTKAALVKFSHTLEDTVLREALPAMIFVGFQKGKYREQEIHRYQQMAKLGHSIYVFSSPPAFQELAKITASTTLEDELGLVKVDLVADDALCQEWFLIVLTQHFSVLLCGLDQGLPFEREADRTFDTVFSFEATIIERSLDMLEEVVAHYRLEKLEQLRQKRKQFPAVLPRPDYVLALTTAFMHQIDMYRPITRQLDQNEAMLATIRTLVHTTSQPMTSLLVLLDLFQQQGYANAEDIQALIETTQKLKMSLTEIRNTTQYKVVKIDNSNHLELGDGNDVIIG